jgi:hypothetical protein
VTRRGALACLALLSGCHTSTLGSLSLELVLPDAPDPATEVHLLRLRADWSGGQLEQEVAFVDAGVRLDLPTGTPIDLRIEGVASSGGAALWRGSVYGATVPSGGSATASLFFGKVGDFSHFSSVNEMPRLAGTAAASWDAGQVILAGGLDENGLARTQVWIYDHAQVHVSAAGNLKTARGWPRALIVHDPSGSEYLMVAGGHASFGSNPDGGDLVDAVELFRPSATPIELPKLLPPQELPGGVLLDPSGLQFLVGCGAGQALLFQVQLYDLSSVLADGGDAEPQSIPLGSDCSGGDLTEDVGETGTFVSGEADGGIERIAWLPPPVGHEVTRIGNAPRGRTHFAAVASLEGLILIGGLQDGAPTDEVDRLDGGVGVLTERRDDFGWLVVPDAGVLIVGGRAYDGGPLASAEWLDPAGLTSRPAGQMANGRIGSSVVEIPGYGAALIVSGEDGSNQPVGGLEIYTYP